MVILRDLVIGVINNWMDRGRVGEWSVEVMG